jgi:asparagine synthase (glutamine-hydrolysing)
MCGIAGIVDLHGRQAPPLEALRRMAAAQLHRGPDELGIYRDDRAGLVHTRLSIIDLASGQQPMANEDDTLFIVFNGEIFNYVELREQLLALGHRFRTKSDTEVVVHAFESWGEQAFERFNGQFAIALWDAPKKRLVLARDRLGVRPIHVAEHDGRLYFASEAKAIFAAEASIPRSFDPRGLDDTFTFWAPAARRTPFSAIRELAPGHLAIVGEGGVLSERAFWRPSYPTTPEETFKGSVEDAAEAVRAALDEATRLRVLRSDVPVGSYLSGGLDSSLVAAMAIGQRQGKLSTFSLRFDDAEYDETSFQRMMATRLESQHHELVVSRKDIAEAFPDVVEHTERPLLRTAPAPLFLLSRLVQSRGTKVVLTGEGADEMFAGYDLFREAKVRRFWAKAPQSTFRPLLLERLYPYLARSPVAERAMAKKFFGRRLEDHHLPHFSHEPRWHSTGALKRLFSPAMKAELQGRDAKTELLASLPPELASWSPLAQGQFLEIATLLSPYILCSQGDRMLMAHSVEGRFPFLDVNVVALAASLPPEHKLKVLDEKHVLKRAAKELVAPEILKRAKQPYRAPDALSFVGETPPAWVEEVLSERALVDAGVFDPTIVRALWTKCARMRDDAQFSNADNMALVGVLSTQLLHERLLRSRRSRGRDGSNLEFKTFVDRSGGRA